MYKIHIAPKNRKAFVIEIPATMERAEMVKIARDMATLYTPECVSVNLILPTNIDDEVFGGY